MADMPRPTPEELARHARQHLESLSCAGVDCLPKAPASTHQSVAASAMPETAPHASLFADMNEPGSTTGPTVNRELPALSPEQRRQALRVLAEQVSPCTRCAE